MNDEERIEVLVVDDDDLVRRMLVKVLERRGFQTHAAADGMTALRLVDELDVDVVLLDQGLPDISGTEVLARLRTSSRTATLPVILVTGQADIEARVGGLQAGADDYLVKPVNIDELVARVNAQIRGRDAWRSQVQDTLHERAQLAGALAAIEPSDDPVVATSRLVDVLRRIPAVRRASVIEFAGDHEAHVLARSDVDGTASRRLDPLDVVELRSMVGSGATVLPRRLVQALHDDAEGDGVGIGVDVAGRTVALVLLETDVVADRPGSPLEVLSAAIDFSPLVDRVLLPSLESAGGGTSLVARLQGIIDRVEFRPVFQPVVDLRTGQVAGFEALTRFDDGMRPDHRFAEADHAGLGIELELATARRSIELSRDLPAGCYLSLNTSASLLLDGRLEPLLDLVGERPLVLELTEHERIDDYESVRSAFDRLGRGLRLSVDDAGSGWASMRHVFSLTPDFVKLDRMWVSRIDTDRARQALLLGMSRFVAELNGSMVAEGIESRSELDALRSLGISFGQGYLLGRPAPVEEFAGLDPRTDLIASLHEPA